MTTSTERHHTAGHYNGIYPEDRPRTTIDALTRQTRKPPVHPQCDEEDDDAFYPQRMPTSARRYHMPVTQGPQTLVRYHHMQVPPRQSRIQAQDSPPVQRQTRERPPVRQSQAQQAKTRSQWHWSVYVGLTLLVGLVLYVAFNVVGSWWHVYQDDQQYGRPRTSQCDARVGHDDTHTPSHFLAVNLNKHIEVIELPGGDATKAKIYQGPTLIGDGQELTPVTLEFRDVNGDGKPDMILHIGESRSVFINDNEQFRPLRQGDNVTLSEGRP